MSTNETGNLTPEKIRTANSGPLEAAGDLTLRGNVLKSIHEDGGTITLILASPGSEFSILFEDRETFWAILKAMADHESSGREIQNPQGQGKVSPYLFLSMDGAKLRALTDGDPDAFWLSVKTDQGEVGLGMDSEQGAYLAYLMDRPGRV